MSLTLTEIANQALAMVGQVRVSRLDTDTSEAAQLCRDLLPGVRRECLVRHPWNFALRRASLPALAQAPAFGYARAFQVPADCLRVWRIVGADPHQPWAREADQILCDLPAPLPIRYIADVGETGRWSPLFARMVAATLAERLAVPLTASQQAAERIAQALLQAQRDARAVDGAEGTPDPAYDSAGIFVQARY